MKLSLLLFGLSLKLRATGRSNPQVRDRLRSRSASVRIRTADQREGRLFVFGDGRVLTKSGGHGGADATLVWKDADTAFQAMTSRDPQAVAGALERGDLTIVGDPMVAQWFAGVIQAMKGPALAPTGSEAVAVIGLGKMGAGLAVNIQSAGFPLVVYNRTAAKAQPFIDRGARLAASPRDAATQANIVVTSLMDDASVRNIVTAPDGILAGLAPGGIHLCATTISPELAKELAELHRAHGSHFVSGAVVGRPDVAEAGELISLVAGDTGAVARCKPVCAAYSSTTMVLGEDPGLANFAKLSFNYFAVANMELMGQIYAYGDAVGIERDLYARMFNASFANPTLKMYADKIGERAYTTGVGFELSGGLKDVKLMKAASDATCGSLDYASVIIGKMEAAVENGWSDRDWSVFTEISRRDAAGQVRAGTMPKVLT
ncbi:NAD(P)-binding domain-containing protein [Sedimentitalea sp. XS_ASV28]|uniref:NAD(P)-binding domain-containing protein n=1 Tax=Sedimentitalea sp. XS_ASV28 TaxID=3241296 RepID=UPI0035134689